MRLLILPCLILPAIAACAAPSGPSSSGPRMPVDLASALDSISADDLLRHTKTLASDEYEGRSPGTKGEELTVKYLVDEFRRIGLAPGNPDGTYLQKVPLAGFTAEPHFSIVAGGRRTTWKFPDDYIAMSRRFVPDVKVETSDVVFVGYGVVAPEYGWDDYKGVDVRGKTIVMLINDPAVPDASDPAKLDEKMFKGKAMTYFGRWTYKYEVASEKGAAAAIIVHEEGPAGYPYEVVSGTWGRENFDIVSPDKNMGRVAVESWVRLDRAKELFKAAGYDFDALKKSAASKDFKPVPLDVKATFNVKNTLRVVESQNVIGRLEGSDARLKDENVIYTAHWDHLGVNNALEGDRIYNGALDNASGTAQLLDLAEAFTMLPKRPGRSVLFLAVTAEERNLLGAKYYATMPLHPLNRTLAAINIDGANPWGRTKDVVIVGDGNSTLDDLAREVLAMQGRVVTPDPETEKGFYYRSDHFEFAKQGVPALYVDTGTEFIGQTAEYSRRKREEYTANDYHKPSDEVKPDWDLTGAVEDAQLLFVIGHRLAEARTFPEWKPGAEFKAKRDAMMKAR